MHGWAYAVVHNLMQKGNIGNRERGTGNGDGESANAERPSLVLCHWSFAAARRPRERGGRGTRELPKRQTAADGRESGFGNRRPGFAARRSSPVARRAWLVANGSWLAACGIWRPGTRPGGQAGNGKSPGFGDGEAAARTFGCRPGRAPAPLVISRPKAGARPGLHARQANSATGPECPPRGLRDR